VTSFFNFILTVERGTKLRLLKYENVFLSTLERDPARDPAHIHNVETTDHKDDNLFPSILPPPPGEECLPIGLESSSKRKKHGYRICWSQTNYEWYPYLPAVVDFRYPIFRGMSCNPVIIHDGSGYSLKKEEISMWQNVEFVMLTIAKALGSGVLTPLEQRDPHPPSEYGYTRSHSQEKFARKSATKSLNAFQRLLGFCAYAVAESPSWKPIGDHRQFYSDRWISGLYDRLDPKNPDLHILAKLLLSSLWKMRDNHTGVVVNYREEYDYPAVSRMIEYNVPVYVAWPSRGVNPYAKFRHSQYLDQLRPKAEHFEDLETPRSPEPITASLPAAMTSTTHRNPPPATANQATYDHPLDYVKRRLALIPAELENSPRRQAMLDRLASALRHSNIGSAKFYEFECVVFTDQQTGRAKAGWVRNQLEKRSSKELFEEVDNRRLWHVYFFVHNSLL
jgi:hypothetical protein